MHATSPVHLILNLIIRYITYNKVFICPNVHEHFAVRYLECVSFLCSQRVKFHTNMKQQVRILL